MHGIACSILSAWNNLKYTETRRLFDYRFSGTRTEGVNLEPLFVKFDPGTRLNFRCLLGQPADKPILFIGFVGPAKNLAQFAQPGFESTDFLACRVPYSTHLFSLVLHHIYNAIVASGILCRCRFIWYGLFFVTHQIIPFDLYVCRTAPSRIQYSTSTVEAAWINSHKT